MKKFLLSAPPGEFMEVLTDIRGLVSDESIINEGWKNLSFSVCLCFLNLFLFCSQ